jgi:hypothetical protein
MSWLRCRVVPHGEQLAAGIGRQLDPLFSFRAIAVRGEHLLARHHELDRSTDSACRHGRENGGRPGIPLAAKSAADEGADDGHVLPVKAEQ